MTTAISSSSKAISTSSTAKPSSSSAGSSTTASSTTSKTTQTAKSQFATKLAGAAIDTYVAAIPHPIAKGVTVANTLLYASDHRTTGEWVAQGDHRTPGEWLAQGNHRTPGEWLSGAPSKNKKS